MKAASVLILFAAQLVALAGCTARRPEVGLPYSLMQSDDGTTSGVWRRGSLVVTIHHSIGTFAARRGCTVTGGTLTPISDGRYRIGRYETGFSTETCGPWRSGPAVAPFDGGDVALRRVGDRLTASGATGTVSLLRERR